MPFIPEVNSNIPLSIQYPGPGPQPAQQLGQLYALQSAQRQGQQEQQQIQQQTALREAMQGVDLTDPNALTQAAQKIKGIDPKAAFGLVEEATKAKEEKARSDYLQSETQYKQAQTKSERLGQIDGFFTDVSQVGSTALQNWKGRVGNNTILPGTPSYDKAMQDANSEIQLKFNYLRQKYRGDPEILSQIDQLAQKQYNNPQELETGLRQLSQAHAPVKQAMQAESPEGKAYQDFRNGVYGDPNSQQAKDTLKQVLAKETHVAPTTNIIMPGPVVTDKTKDLSGEDYLKTLPPDFAQAVRAVGNYEVPAPTLTRSPQNAKIIEAVRQAYPNYSADEFQARAAKRRDYAAGPTSKNVVAINTAIGHMGTFADLGSALQNNDLPRANQILNQLATETGDARVNNLQTAGLALGDELARTFRQVGMSEAEAEAWRKRFSPNMSPEQLRGVTQTAAKLLRSRIQSIEDSWTGTFGDTKGMPKLVYPTSQQTLDRLGVGKEGKQEKVGPYSDPDKERRYQEYLKRHEQNATQ